jgi:hypothetical protein
MGLKAAYKTKQTGKNNLHKTDAKTKNSKKRGRKNALRGVILPLKK